MVILNRYKYIIVTVLMIISILSINVIKPKAELIDSINLINNGNFGNGTTGWYAKGGTLSINIDGNLVMTANGTRTSPYIEKIVSPSLINNSSIFIKYRFRSTGDNVTSITFYAKDTINNKDIATTVISNPVKNQWYEGGVIKKATLTMGNCNFRISPKYTTTEASNDQTFEVDYFMVINLTATYGAGNEPNLMDCNAIYNEYFEGLKRQDIKPYDATENAHKTFIQMIISTMSVPIDMLKKYKVGNQISLFDIFIGMIILVILTKTILKIGGKISNDVR